MPVNAVETKTLADVPNVCWTKKNCEDKIKEQGGVFKSENFEEHNQKGQKCFNKNFTANGEPYDKKNNTKLITTETLGQCKKTPKGSTLKVAIPGYKPEDTTTGKTNIAQYVKAIYEFAVAITALLAVIMIMIAGVRWMTAMGNQSQLDSAKTMILNSLIGLILALSSYTILSIINPALVSLHMPQVAMIRTKELILEQCKYDKEEILFAKTTIDLDEGTLCHKKCTGENVVGQSTPTFTKAKRWEWTIVDRSAKKGLCKCCATEVISCSPGNIELNPEGNCDQSCKERGADKGEKRATLTNKNLCCECLLLSSDIECFLGKKGIESQIKCDEFCKQIGQVRLLYKDSCCQCTAPFTLP